MTQAVVVYDDFSKGEYGELGGRRAGQAKGYFSGLNMLVNREGIVHPRPGLRDLGATGMPTVEQPVAFGWHGYGGGVADNDGVWFVADDGADVLAYGLLVDGGANAAVAYTDTDSISLTGRNLYGANILNGGYSFDWLTFRGTTNSGILVNHDAQEVTIPGAPPEMPDAAVMHVYGDRLFVAGSDVDVNRVYYSDAGILSWGSFPALNFFDALDGLDVTSMCDHRGGVMIGKRIGRFGYLTGTVGLTARLEQVTRSGAPANPGAFLGLGSDEVAFVGRNRNYVQLWNGSLFQDLKHLTFMGTMVASDDFEATSPHVKFVQQRDPKDFLVYRSSDDSEGSDAAGAGMMRVDGCYTYHQFGVGVMGHAVRLLELPYNIFLGWDYTDTDPQEPVVYAWDPTLERPAIAGDSNFASPGDGSETEPVVGQLTLPQHWDPNGRELRARSVIVDFVKWDLDITDLNNTFTVTVTALSLYQEAGTDSSASQAFSELSTAGSFAGVPDRRIFNFGDQGVGAGFEVSFEDIVGIGIRSVSVVYDVLGARTGG